MHVFAVKRKTLLLSLTKEDLQYTSYRLHYSGSLPTQIVPNSRKALTSDEHANHLHSTTVTTGRASDNVRR